MGEKITPATPLPWEYEELSNGFALQTHDGVIVCGAESDYDPLWLHEAGTEDAAYIVHACNTFPALLEALEAVRQVMFDGILNSDGRDVDAAIKKMCAAISAAKGEAQ